MQAEYFALEGISELISTLERVRAAFNPELNIEGVLLTMYDDRTNLAQQVTDTLREYFRERLFQTVIPRNIRLAEAPSHGKPVALYDPRSRGTEAYFELAGEFLARNQMESPRSAERKAAGCGQARVQGRFLALFVTLRRTASATSRLQQTDSSNYRRHQPIKRKLNDEHRRNRSKTPRSGQRP